jgi:hypothetical protein
MRAPLKRFLPRVGPCLLWAACAGAAAPGAEFMQDFRGHRFDPRFFRPTGVHTPRTVRAGPGGLRITLPADHNSKLPVGVVPRLRVRGDFEITVAFEILQVDKPKAGHGAGVSIWITMVSPTKEAATIARVVRPSGERVFTSHRASTPPGEKRVHRGGKPMPTEALSGKLRLVREGALLSYQVAEGGGKAFRELYQTELGTEDLDLVRFAADNGGSPTLVDVRINGVSIRADDFPSGPPEGPPTRRALWLAAGLAVLLLAAGGCWLWWRRARSTGCAA